MKEEVIYGECKNCHTKIVAEVKNIKPLLWGETNKHGHIPGTPRVKKDGTPMYQTTTKKMNEYCNTCMPIMEIKWKQEYQEAEKRRKEQRQKEIEQRQKEKEKSLQESHFSDFNTKQILVTRVVAVQQHKNGFKVTTENEDIYQFPVGKYFYRVANIKNIDKRVYFNI